MVKLLIDKLKKASFLATFLLAWVISLMILLATKTSVGSIIVIFLVLLYSGLVLRLGIEIANKYALYFIIFSIPLPYLLQFANKDALTITTLLIIIIFVSTVMGGSFAKARTVAVFKVAYIFPTLIIISFTISLVLNPILFGQSFRYYVANVSGVLLYFVTILTVKNKNDISAVMKIITGALLLQSFIMILQHIFPPMENLLVLFGTRLLTPQSAFVEGMERATGTVLNYELLAEWFLIGAVLSIAIIYDTRKYIYSISLFLCMIGMIFTKTRSAVILFLSAFILILTLPNILKRNHAINSIRLLLVVLIFVLMCVAIFPAQTQELLQRLEKYLSFGKLVSPEAINRQGVWENVAKRFIQNVTLFGAGLYNVETLYSWAGSFHSLYLTILYKFGIFGIVVHTVFWAKLMQKGLYYLIRNRNSKNWYQLFFLTLAVALILVDGVKVEYLRDANFIQFAWLLYALLVASIQGERYENIVVSKATI